MRLACAVLALSIAAPAAARAQELPYGYPPPRAPYGRARYQPQARQGLLLSFGLGGGSLYLSDQGHPRLGAGDVDFRLGYGFSDFFQTFMDFNADTATTYSGKNVGTWTWTIRGQALLVGDRAGNGLNANLGLGFGGLTYNPNVAGTSAGPTGLALAGGLSYDARITRWVSFSPEFFFTWHQVPMLPGYADGVSSIYGVRVNLLWYLH